MKIKKKRISKTKFSKKDWEEIFDRAATNLLLSIVTQAFKSGVSTLETPKGWHGKKRFIVPTILTTPHHPKKRTRNPAYDRRRKGKARGSD